MAATTTQAGSTRSRSVIAAAGAFACLVAGVVAIGPASDADGARAKEIGKTGDTPKPSCPTPDSNNFPPRKACRAYGEVTGFQVRGNGKQGLMKVPADGHIVGWAVDLSRPNKKEQKFFEDVLGDRAFNGQPSARIAFVTHSAKKKYRLRAQGPNVKLGSLLGRRQYFTLNNPIEVHKGWIAAITSKTWIPNLAHDLPGGKEKNRWRASRRSKFCDDTPQSNLTEKSHPHNKVGSTKVYGCTYDDRLLYWAYFVKS